MNDITHDEGKAKAKAGFSSAEYNAVATSSNLGAINMLASNFSVNPECLGEVSDWKLSYNRKVLSCSYDEEARYVAAIFQYEVVAKLGRRKAMRCTADFGVYYNTTADAPEAAAIGFCRNTGSFAAYPYFRALVAQLAWNAGVTLPPLPAIASTAHIPKQKKAAQIEGNSNEE
jgi:hypothetical protein